MKLAVIYLFQRVDIRGSPVLQISSVNGVYLGDKTGHFVTLMSNLVSTTQ